MNRQDTSPYYRHNHHADNQGTRTQEGMCSSYPYQQQKVLCGTSTSSSRQVQVLERVNTDTEPDRRIVHSSHSYTQERHDSRISKQQHHSRSSFRVTNQQKVQRSLENLYFMMHLQLQKSMGFYQTSDPRPSQARTKITIKELLN